MASSPGTSPFKSKEQRRQERELKRDAVLVAAVQMFNERGFHSTSLDDVAASLGVSKPTIYHYLGNKEQVLLECVSRGAAELREAAAVAAAVPGTGLDRLRAYLSRYAQINMDHFGRCVIRTPDEGLSAHGREHFRSLKRDIDRTLRRLIGDAMADGSMAQGDVRLVAFTLAGALNGPARWFRNDGPDRPEAIAERMVDLLFAGVAASPA